MIPVAGFEEERVGVLGLGRSGLATARALAAGGAQPVLWDDAEPTREAAQAAGFEIADLARAREAEGLAALIVSPGVPHLYPAPHPAITAAHLAGVPVDNDVGLFFQMMLDAEEEGEDGIPPRIVCITGSNGKSTTTALVHHCLVTAGRVSQIGGNIGRGVLDLDPPGPGETVVLELSSYQIDLARSLAPDVAVFLNLSPDHLDRHGGMGGYFAAKRRLFDLGAPARAVIGIDEPEGRHLAGTVEEPILISARTRLKGDWSVSMARDHLSEWRGGRQMAAIDLRPALGLRGAHNHQNACAAYAALRALGLGPAQIERGLLSFPGLPHRAERVGTARGVLFVNDSKATNADATGHALAAYDRIRWIVGGLAKAGGIEPLRPQFPRIAHAYLIGDAAAAFSATLGDTPHSLCYTLEQAVAAAWADAGPGEVILLSPACASQDQFRDYEARGDAFRAQAQALIAAAGPEGEEGA